MNAAKRTARHCLQWAMRAKKNDRKNAFTLIELLTVIAIIGILAAILIPVVGAARERAHATTSMSNLRQLGIATAVYSTENGHFPAGIETRGSDSYPLWEVLRPYTGGPDSKRNMSIEIWEDPKREIKVHPSGSAVITPSYSANRFIFVDSRTTEGGGANQSRVPDTALQRPSEAIALICAGQRSPSGWSIPILIGGIFNQQGNPATADNFVTGAPITQPDADIGNGVRYRYNGRAHAVFVDGHVEAIAKGEIRERNLFINY